MKHLLNGVAIAAALAITAPTLAQAQTPETRPAGPTAAPTGGHAMRHATTARSHRPQRPMHARRTTSRGMASVSRSAAASPGDNVANQLNQQELQRLETGPAPAAMTRSAPVMPLGPRVSGGGNIRPGVAGPVSSVPGAAEEGPRVSGGGNIAAPTGPVPMPPPPPIAAPVR
jgi:hypothetical protein